MRSEALVLLLLLATGTIWAQQESAQPVPPNGPVVQPTANLEKAQPASASLAGTSVAKPVPAASAQPASWIPPDLDDAIPDVDANVECPLPDILKMAGERMTEFVGNIERFSATEHVEHSKIDASGARHSPELRSFVYLAIVSHNSSGLFQMDEYRNGSLDPSPFPAGVATLGLPAMAMIFHPILVADFNFKCEGLGQWGGRPAWQVHFQQRPDRPSRLRGYIINKAFYSVSLKGRAWIDPETDQVVRLESELIKPVKEIALTKERFSIEYGSVDFASHGQQLWLPQVADLYVEREGHRYYRRHTFSNFQLFTVSTDQTIQTPKQSYSFMNTSGGDIIGMLTVTPVPGSALKPVSITFTIPAGKTIYKLLGPGNEIGIPAQFVGSATFAHNGPDDSVKVSANLTNDSTVDVIPNSQVLSDR